MKIARSTTRIGLTALFGVSLFALGCGSDDGGGEGPDAASDASHVDGGAHDGSAGGPDAQSDAHADAPSSDGATDASGDSEVDASTDGGADASTDGGADASTDGGSDASTDGGSGDDASSDAGLDASADAGNDAGDGGVVAPSVSVLTQHNDSARTGANLAETTLTPANVNPQQFGKLYCRAVDDQVYTQPLIAAGVDVAGVGKRDVLYVATVNDTVYAFDANDGNAPALWTKSYLDANLSPPRNTDMTGACGGNYTDFSGNMGIVGTPVIDPATQTMYLVARTRDAGGTFVQQLHALDIRDGSERANSPMTITATVAGTGAGTTTVAFDPQKNNQRASLLLDGGLVYIAWSSHCDWGPYHGWLMAFDASTLQRLAAYASTPDGYQGGIWMSGQGPAADGTGAVYLTTGNGSVGTVNDPRSTRNRSESILKLRKNGAVFTTVDWFTPFNFRSLESRDLDLGSSGLVLVPGSNAVIAGSKSHTVYVVDRTNMGGLNATRSDGQILQSIDLTSATPNAKNVHGAPVYWKGPFANLVYMWAEYDHLQSFPFDASKATMSATAIATSQNPAPDGMPGAMLSISSSGSSDGIVWANLPLSGDANNAVVPGVLRAFDASNVGTQLWSSDADAARDGSGSFGKFTSPTIANGKVYLSTFSSQVCVYGLLPNVTPSLAPTSLAASAPSKTRITLTWTDNATDETGYAVERQNGALGFTRIATLASNVSLFDDNGVTPFATYRYRVRALGPSAPSAYSNVVVAVPNGGSLAPRIEMPTASTDGDFGMIASGSVARTFTIVNTGDTALVTSTVTLGGANASSFVLTSQPPATIAAGGTGTFGITFTPASFGPFTAMVDVPSNDPDQAHYTFAIHGGSTSDLVGWWKLDEGTGQVAADSSGYGNVGAGSGLAWGAGHAAGAGSFDGNGFFAVRDSAHLSPEKITVAAWINPADWTGNHRVLQKGGYDDQYRFLAEGGTFLFNIANVGSVTTALPPVNTWTHVAATYDRVTLRLYVNGVQVASMAVTAAMPETPDPLFIGVKGYGAPLGDHFKGLLDDVRIYERALGAAEIQALAQ